MPKICKICGDEYENPRSKALYCSDTCRNRAKTIAAQKRRNNTMLTGRKCAYCNKFFMPELAMQTCCCEDHAIKRKKHVDLMNMRNRCTRLDHKPLKATPKKQYVSPVSDAEQRKINAEIKAKLNNPAGPVKVFSQEEIEAVKHKITPPELIPQRHYSFTGGKYMETVVQ